MADANVYSSKQFELFIADQTTMGTANTTGSEFLKLDVVSVSDVDIGGGLVQERNLRSGQQIKKSTDHYVSQKGSSASLSFEWVVSHKEGLQQLMKMISEDTASAYEKAGNSSPAVYNHGADTGELATVIVSNPRTSDDRVLHSCALTSLDLTFASDSEGGRLVASGELWSGYRPSIGASSVAPSATETAWVKTIFDCDEKTINGDDMVAKSFSMSWGFPCSRVGFQGANAEPEQYSRSGEYTVSGEANVKYDALSDTGLAKFLNGNAHVWEFGEGTGGSSTFNFKFPTAIHTGYSVDLGDSEEGVFVSVPFEGVADGGAVLYSVIIA